MIQCVSDTLFLESGETLCRRHLDIKLVAGGRRAKQYRDTLRAGFYVYVNVGEFICSTYVKASLCFQAALLSFFLLLVCGYEIQIFPFVSARLPAV